MNSLCLFILLCVVSIPLFTIEFVGNLFSGQVYQFRFFTILTNILCWIYFITKLIFVLISRKNQDYLRRKSPKTRFETFLSCFGFVCTVSITLVCIVFWGMLTSSVEWNWNLESVYLVFDHLVVPVAKIIDYFCFTPNEVRKGVAVGWSIVYPLCYYCVTLIIGLTVDHWFPYWFLDPTKLSWGMIGVWFVILVIFYLAMDWLYIYLGDKVSAKKKDSLELPLY